MALKRCRECGGEISTAASVCPHCGNPIRRHGVPLNALTRVAVLLFFGVLVVASITKEGPPGFNATSSTNAPSAPEPQLPTQEAEFCRILEYAKQVYGGLRTQWWAAREQKNGIVQDRLSAEMTSRYASRNADVFRLIEQNNFTFEDWFGIVKGITPWPEKEKIIVRFHPFCSSFTTIHGLVVKTPANVDFLSLKKKGDRLLVTGRFAAKRGAQGDPTSPEELEGSLTEGGSMDAPEYTAAITLLDGVALSAPEPPPNQPATEPVPNLDSGQASPAVASAKALIAERCNPPKESEKQLCAELQYSINKVEFMGAVNELVCTLKGTCPKK
jgi:hypothetical protein